MTELLTAAQMRSLEQAAIASGEVTGLELMERAGRGVVAAIDAEWPDRAAAPGQAVPPVRRRDFILPHIACVVAHVHNVLTRGSTISVHHRSSLLAG